MNHAVAPDHDPYRRFVARVLTSAYWDLEFGDDIAKQKARHFFDSRDCQAWGDLIELDHDVVIAGMRNVLANGLPLDNRRGRNQWGAHESRGRRR